MSLYALFFSVCLSIRCQLTHDTVSVVTADGSPTDHLRRLPHSYADSVFTMVTEDVSDTGSSRPDTGKTSPFLPSQRYSSCQLLFSVFTCLESCFLSCFVSSFCRCACCYPC